MLKCIMSLRREELFIASVNELILLIVHGLAKRAWLVQVISHLKLRRNCQSSDRLLDSSRLVDYLSTGKHGFSDDSPLFVRPVLTED